MTLPLLGEALSTEKGTTRFSNLVRRHSTAAGLRVIGWSKDIG
jgi:hypothetical protein